VLHELFTTLHISNSIPIMFKHYVILIFVFLGLWSCAKKEVELPIIPVSGTTEIANHSQIWVFLNFDEKKMKASVNKNNTISTTHWIINIDKRLPMDEVVPVLEMIRAKRDKKSVHSADGMQNYLSYSNSKDKNISLFPINTIQYLVLDPIGYEDLIANYGNDYFIHFKETGFSFNKVNYKMESFNASLFDTLQKKPFHFFFDGTIPYQTYLEKRVLLSSIAPKDLPIDHTEYIVKN
jgi:hypothetical protein